MIMATAAPSKADCRAVGRFSHASSAQNAHGTQAKAACIVELCIAVIQIGENSTAKAAKADAAGPAPRLRHRPTTPAPVSTIVSQQPTFIAKITPVSGATTQAWKIRHGLANAP